MTGRIAWRTTIPAALLLANPWSAARADRILLQGTGELKGVVVPDPAGRDGMIGVLTERTITPLPLKQAQVARVIEEPGPLRDYVERLAKAEASATAHYELGLWCEQQKLVGPATIEFRKAIEIDAAFAPARLKLNHVLVDDQWMTPDEAKLARGLVKIKGKWVTPDEKERLDDEAALGAEQSAWARQLRVILGNLKSPKPDNRRAAEQQLAEVKEPSAVPGLIKVFGKEAPELRLQMFRTLDGIAGELATDAIVRQYLAEPDAAVRASALGLLKARPVEEVHPRLGRVLKSNQPDPIGRAATALAEAKVQASVPGLIAALIQTYDHVEIVPVAKATGGGGGFFSGRTYTYPAAAIPVTAPGAVAYQVVPNTIVDGVAMGGGGGVKIEPEYQMIRDYLPNNEVRAALVSLTGQDFGFEVAAWKNWLSVAKRPGAADRRVPQP